jgi:hypothetical protein
MTFLLLALSLNACKTGSDDDQPSLPLDVVGHGGDMPAYEEPAVEPSKAEAAAEPASQATPTTPPAAPTVVKRTDCSFTDPERTPDAAGKVTVKCGDSVVQAKAIYLDGGTYEFEIEEADLEGS